MSGYRVFDLVGAVVRCRTCGGPALLDTPFEFYSARKGLPEGETRPAHRWNGWLVVEKHPSIVRWMAPEAGHSYTRLLGVASCSRCHAHYAYDVSWPDDAHYRWDIRGHILWAFNREHARVLQEFIGSKDRDPSRYPGYKKSLTKLPTEFITAKVRDDIVKAISRTLETGE
jgi:hypothetical protein